MMKRTLLTLALSLPMVGFAFNGFYPVGYGTPAQGMGGAGIALPQDTLAVALNPAGLVYLGSRIDAGFGWIGFDGHFSRIESPSVGFDGRFCSSESLWYPELGVTWVVWPNLAIGLAYYLNGTFDVDVGAPVPSFGTTRFEAYYRQYALTPFVSWAIDDCHLVGLSVPIGHGSLKFHGFERLIPLSSDPTRVTNRGDAHSWGAGVRVGWVGCFFDILSAGVTFQTPIWMGRFSEYAGLISNHGDFDAPARAGGGVGFFGYPGLLFAFDVEYIFNNDVRSFGSNALSVNSFGLKGGPGLGWCSSWVLKVGAAYEVLDNVQLRIGYNWGESPIDANAAFANFQTLATPEHHLTIGGSAYWGCHELSIAYVHAFCNRVHGPISPRFDDGGKASLKNESNHVSLSYGVQL